MNKKTKLFLTFGSLTTLALPVVSVVSCGWSATGQEDGQHTTNPGQYDEALNAEQERVNNLEFSAPQHDFAGIENKAMPELTDRELEDLGLTEFVQLDAYDYVVTAEPFSRTDATSTMTITVVKRMATKSVSPKPLTIHHVYEVEPSVIDQEQRRVNGLSYKAFNTLEDSETIAEIRRDSEVPLTEELAERYGLWDLLNNDRFHYYITYAEGFNAFDNEIGIIILVKDDHDGRPRSSVNPVERPVTLDPKPTEQITAYVMPNDRWTTDRDEAVEAWVDSIQAKTEYLGGFAYIGFVAAPDLSYVIPFYTNKLEVAVNSIAALPVGTRFTSGHTSTNADKSVKYVQDNIWRVMHSHRILDPGWRVTPEFKNDLDGVATTGGDIQWENSIRHNIATPAPFTPYSTYYVVENWVNRDRLLGPARDDLEVSIRVRYDIDHPGKVAYVEPGLTSGDHFSRLRTEA